MPSDRRRSVAATCAAISVLAWPASVNIASAHASPLPDFCVPSSVVDNVCTARLASVTSDVANGTITGRPVGGGTAVTLAGQADAYRKSAGFGDARPDLVQQWDTAIDNAGSLNFDQSDPNWYANAKTRAFLPRTLNDLASRFPPNILVVGFTPDDAQPGSFRLVSIQPTR